MRKWLALLLIPGLFIAGQVWGAMSSTNYYIYADVISVGGVLSTSSAYVLNDTAGEPAVGTSVSSTYEIRGGYQYMEPGELSLLVGSQSLSLGSLFNYTASSSVSTNVFADSGSASGFSLAVGGVTGTSLAAVVDGAVDGVIGGISGAEEYGLGLTGPYAAFFDDRAIAPGLVLASSIVPATSDTVLIFKAIRNTSTILGTYSQNINLIVSANF